MMDPLTNDSHLTLGGPGGVPTQADQLRNMTRVPEQMVPKIETGIIDITPHHLGQSQIPTDTHTQLDSPQKNDSPPLQGEEGT